MYMYDMKRCPIKRVLKRLSVYITINFVVKKNNHHYAQKDVQNMASSLILLDNCSIWMTNTLK